VTTASPIPGRRRSAERRRRLAAAVLAALVGAAAPAPAGESAPEARVAGIELVRLPGGEFVMGSDEGPAEERPAHRVQLPPFLIGRFEVTQAQWEAVTGENPSHFSGCPQCPVEQVSWDDVQRFLALASAKEGVPLRLPTEAEWEFAAGGGAARQRWPGTDDPDDVVTHAWTKGSFEGRTHPVGGKEPNLFGLYDMGGNVAEWCADRYDRAVYRAAPPTAPAGPDAGRRRVVRGGSFLGEIDDARSSRRSGTRPEARRRSIGFRVAADAEPPRGDGP